MPHNWIVVFANTPPPWDSLSGDPKAFREAIEKTVADFDGAFADMYWDATKPLAYVLVEGPNDPTKLKGLAKALPTKEVFPLLDESEAKKAFGVEEDPPSGA